MLVLKFKSFILFTPETKNVLLSCYVPFLRDLFVRYKRIIIHLWLISEYEVRSPKSQDRIIDAFILLRPGILIYLFSGTNNQDGNAPPLGCRTRKCEFDE